MSTLYKARIFSPSFDLEYEITDFLRVTTVDELNHIGAVDLILPLDHPARNFLDWSPIEIWRKPEGLSWALDWSGFLREPEFRDPPRGDFLARGKSANVLLQNHRVLWRPNTSGRTSFINVEAGEVATSLVDYNIGPNAVTSTLPARLVDGVTQGVIASTSVGTGPLINWFAAYDALLTSLQDIARATGADFEMVRQGPGQYQFVWYAGGKGPDVSEDVVFSLGRGNMTNFRYARRRFQEETTVIIGGPGPGDERAIELSEIAGTPSYTVEGFVDARDVPVGNTAALLNRGEARIVKTQAREEVSFTPLQTPSTLYGVHYGLGSIVSAISPITGETFLLKVVTKKTSLAPGSAEVVEIGLAPVNSL